MSNSSRPCAWCNVCNSALHCVSLTGDVIKCNHIITLYKEKMNKYHCFT